MISVADSQLYKQKEDYLESKSRSCHPRRKTSEAQGTYQEFGRKSF